MAEALPYPPRIRLALVDHNEYAQAVNGIEEAEITEVIDHHRLAGDLVSRVSSDVIQLLRYDKKPGEPGRELERVGPIVWRFPKQ